MPYLTRKGLEQATPQGVADLRAAELSARLPGSRIWDATCGIGADSVALRRADLPVVSSDVDALQLSFARANIERAVHGARVHVVRADAAHLPLRAGGARVLLLDPDRRPTGRREGDPEAWSPPLSTCIALARRHDAACVKLPPGLDPGRIADEGRLRWISLRGELRELSLWTGPFAADERWPEAIVLDGRGNEARMSGEPIEVAALDPGAAREVRWLAEPDPAVIRSGLIGRLCREQGLAPLGPALAYLGGADRPSSPLLRAWRVLGTSPLDPRRVRALLGEHDVGPLTVKKRGHPDPADVLARRLGGPGSQPGLLAVARVAGGHLALLLESVSGS